MAEVFLAEQRSEAGVRKFVALKRLLPHLTRQREFVDMFLDEARLAARLSHQNIVHIVDFGTVDGQYFLAMEYLTGESLQAIILKLLAARQQIPFALALSIIGQACDGLHFAHTFSEGGVPLQVVHRDISPSNLLVTYQGGVKLIDFGIARAADRLQETTAQGIFKGKLSYSSPEQAEGTSLDCRSDVFSLAVVLYELLTCQRLFRRDNDLATLNALAREPAPSVRLVRPELPEALDGVLARALAKKPDDRFASALEFRRALDALAPTAPVRLDDWLESLVGAEAIAKACDLQALVGTSPNPALRAPTLTQQATPGRQNPSEPPEVEQVMLPPSAPVAAPPSEAAQPPAPRPRKSAVYAGLAGLALAGAVGTFALLEWALPRKSDTAAPERPQRLGAPGEARAEPSGAPAEKPNQGPLGAPATVEQLNEEAPTAPASAPPGATPAVGAPEPALGAEPEPPARVQTKPPPAPRPGRAPKARPPKSPPPAGPPADSENPLTL